MAHIPQSDLQIKLREVVLQLRTVVGPEIARRYLLAYADFCTAPPTDSGARDSCNLALHSLEAISPFIDYHSYWPRSSAETRLTNCQQGQRHDSLAMADNPQQSYETTQVSNRPEAQHHNNLMLHNPRHTNWEDERLTSLQNGRHDGDFVGRGDWIPSVSNNVSYDSISRAAGATEPINLLPQNILSSLSGLQHTPSAPSNPTASEFSIDSGQVTESDSNQVTMLTALLPWSGWYALLQKHWQSLNDGIFKNLYSFEANINDASSKSDTRLKYHLVLRHLENEHELYQWRRALAELQNLKSFEAFLAEVTDRRSSLQLTGHRGKTDSSVAQEEYLTHIFANKSPSALDRKSASRGLKKDLQYGRRWRILIDGYVDPVTGNRTGGLGSGVLLLCSPRMKKKIYNPRAVRNPVLENLLSYIHVSQPDIVQCCRGLQPIAESLVETTRLQLLPETLEDTFTRLQNLARGIDSLADS